MFADAKDPSEQAYVNAARANARRIKASPESRQDPKEIVQAQLARAQTLNPLAARRLLESIVELYRDNSELAPLVEQARQQLRDLDSRPSPTAPAGETEEASEPPTSAPESAPASTPASAPADAPDEPADG